MGDKVRFGVIGCGVAAWMGHLPWVWGYPDAELTAVCDADLARAQQAQQRYRARFATIDYEALLAQPDVDAVCIGTPPSSHYDIAMAAAAHQKHILLKKPMGRSLQAYCDMIASAQEHGAILMLGHEKRFNFACERVKQIIDSGIIGQVFIWWFIGARRSSSRRSSLSWLVTAKTTSGARRTQASAAASCRIICPVTLTSTSICCCRGMGSLS